MATVGTIFLIIFVGVFLALFFGSFYVIAMWHLSMLRAGGGIRWASIIFLSLYLPTIVYLFVKHGCHYSVLLCAWFFGFIITGPMYAVCEEEILKRTESRPRWTIGQRQARTEQRPPPPLPRDRFGARLDDHGEIQVSQDG